MHFILFKLLITVYQVYITNICYWNIYVTVYNEQHNSHIYSILGILKQNVILSDY